MKLSWRILLLVLLMTTLSGLGSYFLAQYQAKSLHKDSEKILANTVFQSLRDALVQDVIDGNQLRVTNLLRKLQGHDNPIEFLYITDGGPLNIFAHSFKNGFPGYLLVDDEGHLEKHLAQSGIEITKKYQTDQGLTFVYAAPLIPGLEAILHIGINQTEIIKKLAENTQYLLEMSVLITLVALLLAYFWSRKIIEPLVSFTHQLKRFGKGEDTNFKNIKTSTPEIQMLASTFQQATLERNQAEEALRESEQYNRMLFEQSRIGLALCQMNGELVDINPAFASILGRTVEETKSLSYWDITPKKYAVEEQEQLNILEKTNKYGPYEKEYIHADGHLVPVRLSGQFLKKDGVKFIWSSVEDITEHKQAEDEKEHLQLELQRSQKMEALGKLTGGIAHEYNNMLAITMGFATLLEEALVAQPKLAKYAHEIHHAGERGAKLTSKLLTFSRQSTSEADSLNLNALLQMQHHMLEKTLTVRINLVFNLQENLWLVWLDESELEDAILNMSINAMHAIEGNGQLTIQTRNQKINQIDAQSLAITPGDYVLLSITDTGCGMDQETKEKIFDPFFTTKGLGGTGLGLSMVYGFVQNSGGVIKVYSEQGEGTQFILYIPRYHGDIRDEQSEKENYSEETFISNKTILVVDDEPALLDLIRGILSLHGFNVLGAESAKEALKILQHESIDIIISDIIMPEMDGYQLAAIVKEKYPEIKIQLASGFTDESKMGMVDEHFQKKLLHKPYNSQELLLRIRELCDEN